MQKVLVYVIVVALFVQIAAAPNDNTDSNNPFDDANYVPSFEIDEDGNPIDDYSDILKEIDELNDLVDMDDGLISDGDLLPDGIPDVTGDADGVDDTAAIADEPNQVSPEKPPAIDREKQNITRDDMEQALALRDFLRKRYEQQQEGALPVIAGAEEESVEDKPVRTPRLQNVMSRRKGFPMMTLGVSTSQKKVMEQIVEHELPHISDKETALASVAFAAHQTARELDIKKVSKVEEGRTRVSVTIVPKKPLYNLSIYEKIPKEIAAAVGDITFHASNYEVLESDPLIVWHFEELNEPATTSYSVEKQLAEEDTAAITIVPVAEKIGFNLQSFIPVMIVPIVGMIAVSFNRLRFREKKKKSKSTSELVDFIRKAKARKMTDVQIKAQLKKVGWADRAVQDAFKKTG